MTTPDITPDRTSVKSVFARDGMHELRNGSSQIVSDNAAEQVRLDKQGEQIEEMPEHLAGITKRGKK